MISDYEALQALCRENLGAFTCKAFTLVEPATAFEYNWHIDCIAEHLQAVWDGEINRLIINMPPRSLKTHTTSVAFPAWGLGKKPSTRFMLTSFKSGLAEKMTRKTRMIMKSDWYKETFTGASISDELDRQYYFETTEKGQYYSASMSSVTGEGCFAAGTLVATNWGEMPIESLHQFIESGILILSYDHKKGHNVYRKLRAWREKESDDIVDLQTASGRRVRCTGDHPIYVQGRGYKRADSLQENEELSCQASLQFLQEGNGFPGLRNTKTTKEQQRRHLLLHNLLAKSPRNKECETMQGMRYRNAWCSGSALLLKRMQEYCTNAIKRAALLGMQGNVPALAFQKAILFSQVCGYGTFNSNEEDWKPELQRKGRFLQSTISQGSSQDTCQRPQLLRGLWGYWRKEERSNKPYNTPHRRESGEQRIGKSNNALCFMPYNASQIESDAVSLVERAGCGKIKVYDITVEDTHNFYANGILVHNCDIQILDDPLNPDEAASDQVRQATIETIRGTLFSRFDDPRRMRFILNMQRLHDDDPTGNLLKDGGWTLLKLPAETKTHILIRIKDSQWEMAPGEMLFPKRFTREVLDEKRVLLGEYNYAGQFLQEPIPLGGGVLKPERIQFYNQGSIKPTEMNIAILVDPAGGDDDEKKKKDKPSDWTAMEVIGLAPDKNYYRLDAVRDRLNPTDRIDTLFMLHRKWNALSGKAPKVGYEKYSMQSDIHYIRKKMGTESYHFPLIELGGPKSKTSRILRMEPDINAGRWYFPASLIYMDYEGRKYDLTRAVLDEEMPTFPRARFDDMLDAMSRVYEPELFLTFPQLKPTMAQRAIASGARSQITDWMDF